MTGRSVKMPPHMRARERLLARIAKMAAAGERRLPPERELCLEDGVSLGTVKKALKTLVAEGRIVCVPRKGNFVSPFAPTPNIGLIIGDGAPVTFLCSHDVLRCIIEELESFNCHLRIVHLKNMERAPELFRHYCLDACIWYMPDASLFPKINKVMDEASIPIAVNCSTYSIADEPSLPRNSFIPDQKGIGRLRTSHLIAAGHRRIAFCANLGTRAHEGHVQALGEAGIKHSPKWDIPKIEDIPSALPSLLDSEGITALVSDGGINRLEAIFSALDRHPAGNKVELVVDYTGLALRGLFESYPRIRVLGVNVSPSKDSGRAAARAVISALKYGTPMRTELFCSKLVAPHELFPGLPANSSRI